MYSVLLKELLLKIKNLCTYVYAAELRNAIDSMINFCNLYVLLLSKYMVCKESIVIVKNSTLKFWYIYTFSGLPNLFMLFFRWCMYACVYVSEHDIVWTVHSIELKFGIDITGHRQTNPIDFGEYRMNRFLQECKKVFLYVTAYGVKFFKMF